MIFPTLNLRSSSDPEDALGRIDRAIHDRNHRLSAGISISNRFDIVQGALVVSQGRGKHLHVRHVVAASTPIPQSIRAGCREVFDGRLRDSAQISQLISDLAEPQATVIEQLKCQAGKYVDRVLAVAVCDPGVWDQDFDGRISYAPFCDTTRLAELSGVTVIDAFPARDLAVGGNGNRLESLPYWMLFGDRSPKIASQSRLLVSIDDCCISYFLPASDGLDSELPRIIVFESMGVGFLNELIRRRFPDSQVPTEFDRH
jgi:anhydro-N-acetylmuramic acid kinase